MSDYFDVKIKNSGIIGSIEMTTEDDFYNIYAYLKDEYFSSFSTEIIYISGYGRMMVPAVSDKVSIQIRSDSLSDMNWINEEVYNVKNNNGKTI